MKQVLEAQSRGDSLSREDILNAIMNRTSLPRPPNKTGSIAPVAPLFTPAADTFSPSTPPIRKKVETRDSPAQVDIPNEIAATQRGSFRIFLNSFTRSEYLLVLCWIIILPFLRLSHNLTWIELILF